MRLLRLLLIVQVALRYGLDEFLLGHERVRGVRTLVGRILYLRDLREPRALRLRRALERLGPIFVKFGQVLSTRRDLLPADIADELARLQDRVPPFDSELVLATLERAYGRPLAQVFAQFDPVPVDTGLCYTIIPLVSQRALARVSLDLGLAADFERRHAEIGEQLAGVFTGRIVDEFDDGQSLEGSCAGIVWSIHVR